MHVDELWLLLKAKNPQELGLHVPNVYIFWKVYVLKRKSTGDREWRQEINLLKIYMVWKIKSKNIL